MVRCCLQLGAPGRFLALLTEVGLIAAALAELVRTQRLNAPVDGRIVGTLEMPVAAKHTDAGYTRVKSWDAGRNCSLLPYRGCHNPNCLPFRD